MRSVFIPLLLVGAVASAQDTKTPGAKAPVTAPVSKQDVKTTAAKQDTKAQTKQDTKAAPGATKQDTKAPAGAAAAQGATRGVTVAPPAPPKPPEIFREAFDYSSSGRRDPFNSLMGTGELRPTVADLKLVGVLYHPTRPVAVMRDILTNTQYRVTLGATLGRMRVALIKPRVVIFSIEEFGLNRQDSLVLGDTTKVRAR